jgi:SAM-dependent methyltransferase
MGAMHMFPSSKQNMLKFLEELEINGESQGSNQYAIEHLERYQKTVEFLQSFLVSKPVRVLDLAISPVFCYFLSQKVSGEFYGTSTHPPKFPSDRTSEPKEVSINVQYRNDELACKVIENINLEIDDLPYNDNFFDLVCCSEVIEHLIYSPTKMLCEIFRVLKGAGYLCLTTDNANNMLKVMRILFNRQTYFPLYRGSIYGRHNREYLKHEIEDLLLGIGFGLVRSKYLNYNPFRYSEESKYRWGYDILYYFTHLPFMKKRKKHILILAQPGEELNHYYPIWLYR